MVFIDEYPKDFTSDQPQDIVKLTPKTEYPAKHRISSRVTINPKNHVYNCTPAQEE